MLMSNAFVNQGKELVPSDRVDMRQVDGVATLGLHGITADDSGKYIVMAENTFGMDCHYASLAVEGIRIECYFRLFMTHSMRFYSFRIRSTGSWRQTDDMRSESRQFDVDVVRLGLRRRLRHNGLPHRDPEAWRAVGRPHLRVRTLLPTAYIPLFSFEFITAPFASLNELALSLSLEYS